MSGKSLVRLEDWLKKNKDEKTSSVGSFQQASICDVVRQSLAQAQTRYQVEPASHPDTGKSKASKYFRKILAGALSLAITLAPGDTGRSNSPASSYPGQQASHSTVLSGSEQARTILYVEQKTQSLQERLADIGSATLFDELVLPGIAAQASSNTTFGKSLMQEKSTLYGLRSNNISSEPGRMSGNSFGDAGDNSQKPVEIQDRYGRRVVYDPGKGFLSVYAKKGDWLLRIHDTYAKDAQSPKVAQALLQSCGLKDPDCLEIDQAVDIPVSNLKQSYLDSIVAATEDAGGGSTASASSPGQSTAYDIRKASIKKHKGRPSQKPVSQVMDMQKIPDIRLSEYDPKYTAMLRKHFGDPKIALLGIEAARNEGVDPALVLAVMRTESNFDPKALSHAGAIGLMQIMPGTAIEYGIDPHDPRQNVVAGSRMLKDLLNSYGNIDKALMAYNFGAGNLNNGKSLPKETRNFVKFVRNYYSRYKKLDLSGASKAWSSPAVEHEAQKEVRSFRQEAAMQKEAVDENSLHGQSLEQKSAQVYDAYRTAPAAERMEFMYTLMQQSAGMQQALDNSKKPGHELQRIVRNLYKKVGLADEWYAANEVSELSRRYKQDNAAGSIKEDTTVVSAAKEHRMHIERSSRLIANVFISSESLYESFEDCLGQEIYEKDLSSKVAQYLSIKEPGLSEFDLRQMKKLVTGYIMDGMAERHRLAGQKPGMQTVARMPALRTGTYG